MIRLTCKNPNPQVGAHRAKYLPGSFSCDLLSGGGGICVGRHSEHNFPEFDDYVPGSCCGFRQFVELDHLDQNLPGWQQRLFEEFGYEHRHQYFDICRFAPVDRKSMGQQRDLVQFVEEYLGDVDLQRFNHQQQWDRLLEDRRDVGMGIVYGMLGRWLQCELLDDAAPKLALARWQFNEVLGRRYGFVLARSVVAAHVVEHIGYTFCSRYVLLHAEPECVVGT